MFTQRSFGKREPNGERVTTRYTLRALLDKLDELLSTNPGRD